MKKSYRKVIFREIKQSISRFLAIFFIVALGVGFFAGLMATTPDMRLSADRYYDETHTMDLRVLSTLGLTDRDVDEIRKLDGVSGVMPAYSTDVIMTTDSGDSSVARIHSLPTSGTQEDNPDYLNRVVVTEGRLPQNPGECVLEEQKMGDNPVELGGVIRLSEENPDVSDTLSDTEFTVVGYVKSAYYLSIDRDQSSVGNGKVNMILYVDPGSFSLEAYTDIFVTVSDAVPAIAFSQEYTDRVELWADRLKELGKVQTVARYNEVKEEAQDKLDDAKSEYQDKKAESDQQLEDAKRKLDEGWEQITQSERELADGDAELTTGEAAIQEKEAQLKDAKRQIGEAEATIREKETQLQQGETQWQQGNAALIQKEAELSDAQRQWNASEAELEKQESALQSGEAQWKAGKEELERNRLLLEKSRDQLDRAKQQIDSAKQQIEQLYAAGKLEQAQALERQVALLEKEYLAGLEEYESRLAEFTQAETQLQNKRQELDDGAALIKAGKQQLEAARIQMEDGEHQMAAARKQLAATRAQLDAGGEQLASGKQELNTSKQQYEEGKRLLLEAKAQLDTSRSKLTKGRQQLDTAKQELTDGEQEYQNGNQEAQTKLGDAESQLQEAEDKIGELKLPEWYVLDRSTNLGYASFDSNAEKVEAIAKVFPVFFFLVAALVALTTMTRMIEEERTQIGTLKALGYSKGAIALKYAIYAGVATAAGSLFGLAVGFQIFPTVIWGAYGILYNLPPLIIEFNVPYALISSLAAIFCTMLATFSACYGTLMEAPARLMLPRAPKAGKRVFLEYITPIWSHMRFTHKVTARNLIRYNKRFFMTVIGIAGCTALLLTGFGLRDSISDIVDKQFDELCQYNLSVQVKHGEDIDSDPIIRGVMEDQDRVSDRLLVHQESSEVTAQSGKSQKSVYLYVPQTIDRFQDFIRMRDRKSGAAIPFTEDTVLVTEKMANNLGLRTGSTITIQNADGVKADFTVGGVVENYVYAYVYLSPELYRTGFGSDPEFTQIIAKVPDVSQQNRDSISSELLQSDQVSAAQFTNDLSESFSDIVKNIDYIVMVLIVCAGLLAFIVLYNLTNINITERQKEIATIKVLGFFDKEVSAYIYRETAVLSLIGTGVGLLLGIALHSFVVVTSEVDMVMFGRTIRPMSFIIAALLTLAFSLLVNLVMYRKLKKISMVESMKSGE